MGPLNATMLLLNGSATILLLNGSAQRMDALVELVRSDALVEWVCRRNGCCLFLAGEMDPSFKETVFWIFGYGK